MKYSVILPVYNVETYLAECLDSILAQVPEETQVILVDDGSTDSSGAICEQYASRDVRVEIVQKENGGVASARNTGLERALGDYVLWIDPDDRVMDRYFEAIDRALTESGTDILQFDYVDWADDEIIRHCYGRAPGPVARMDYLRDVVQDIRLNSALWSRVFRRSLFEGLAFDQELRCLEDYDLLHKLILRAETIIYLPEAIYAYRIRRDSLVRSIDLNVAYQSYLVAIRRREELQMLLVPYDQAGVVLQAQRFCANFFRMGMPEEFRGQYERCRQELWQNRGTVWREFDLFCRMKAALVCVPAVGRIYRLIKG